MFSIEIFTYLGIVAGLDFRFSSKFIIIIQKIMDMWKYILIILFF